MNEKEINLLFDHSENLLPITHDENKIQMVVLASLLAGAIILDAQFLFPKADPKAPLFKDVLESELMLPKAVENAALAKRVAYS